MTELPFLLVTLTRTWVKPQGVSIRWFKAVYQVIPIFMICANKPAHRRKKKTNAIKPSRYSSIQKPQKSHKNTNRQTKKKK
jgi:hypothetical protein